MSTWETMESFTVEGFPETKLALAFFKSVKNAAHLKATHLNRVALIDAGASAPSLCDSFPARKYISPKHSSVDRQTLYCFKPI